MARKTRRAEYDPEADAIYVRLSGARTVTSRQLDDARTIDYAPDGSVVGVEFLGVGGGVDLSDVPDRNTVEKLIGELNLGLRIFA